MTGNAHFALLHAAISVNGATIGRDAIGREAQNHPAPTPIESWSQAARALIVRELLLQEARRLDINARPETDASGRREVPEEATIRKLLEQAVRVEAPDEPSCRAFYEANRERFTSPTLYEAAHILLAAAPNDRASRDVAKLKAAELIAALLRAPESFAELAALHSACTSREQGGNLGQISSGQTVPEFEAALASLQAGGIAEAPVETRYGFHIIRLDRKIAGKILPFAMVARRAAGHLHEMARLHAEQAYVKKLAASAVIAGFDLATGRAEPVQNAGSLPALKYASAAVRHFASQASHEDWQSLVFGLDRSGDPESESLSRIEAWSAGRDKVSAAGKVTAQMRVAFTHSGRR